MIEHPTEVAILAENSFNGVLYRKLQSSKGLRRIVHHAGSSGVFCAQRAFVEGVTVTGVKG